MLSYQEFKKELRNSWDFEFSPFPNMIERRKLYNTYKDCFKMNNCPTVCTNFLAPIEVCSPYAYGGKQEEVNSMNYASASVTAPATDVQDQRKYLGKRIEEVYYEKRGPLEATFGLNDDEAPRDPKELKDRLDSGKYIIRGLDKDADCYRYFHASELIQWRDPARKADQDGFEAARKALKAVRQEAVDVAKLKSIDEGFEQLKKLEAWTPTGAAS